MKTEDLRALTGPWLESVDANPATIATYGRAIRPFFSWLDEREITEPSRGDVLRWRGEIASRLRPATVTSYLNAVRLFFSWAESEGYCPDIAARVKSPRLASAHKKDCLTSSQAGRLLDAVDRDTLRGLRDYAILALMATTGLRVISVVGADTGDLRTAADNTVLYYRGKGSQEKAEYVKLAEPVEDAVRAYLRERGSLLHTDPLFASLSNRNSGGRMTARSMSRIIKKHLVDAGLNSDRITAHSLRHTAATINLLQGGSLAETQQLLGHSNISTTMIYSHALERAKNPSEERIARAIFTVDPEERE